jgi:hypothetical protein
MAPFTALRVTTVLQRPLQPRSSPKRQAVSPMATCRWKPDARRSWARLSSSERVSRLRMSPSARLRLPGWWRQGVKRISSACLHWTWTAFSGRRHRLPSATPRRRGSCPGDPSVSRPIPLAWRPHHRQLPAISRQEFGSDEPVADGDHGSGSRLLVRVRSAAPPRKRPRPPMPRLRRPWAPSSSSSPTRCGFSVCRAPRSASCVRTGRLESRLRLRRPRAECSRHDRDQVQDRQRLQVAHVGGDRPTGPGREARSGLAGAALRPELHRQALFHHPAAAAP